MSLLNQSSHIDSHTSSHQQPSWFARTLVLLVCAFLAFCTSIGPLYRAHLSITDFGISNALILVATFAFYLMLVKSVTLFLQNRASALCPAWTKAITSFFSRISRWLSQTRFPYWIRRASATRKSLFLTLLLGWLWVPLFLQVSFGADLQGQVAEVSNWLSQLSGGTNTALYRTLFTQADVYPIAHYLWPVTPTFLTNQHNIVLTMLYGLTIKSSEAVFSTVVPGILLLSFAQYVFAAYCMAATAHRFFTLRSHVTLRAQTLAVVIMLLSPMITLSTISLTKSPLFGFASVWWIGVLYEALHTRETVLPRSTRWELILSAIVMLASAKYAVYIIVVEAIVLLIFSHRSWKTWCTYLVVPVVVFEVALLSLVHTGTIMDADSIESKALQVQQIARVAKYNPGAISADARKKLEPIFNIDNMGYLYFQSDADPVKSSGALGKATSYKWKTVTKDDWKNFTSAWIEIGKAAPQEYADAFFAEFYGYFDVADPPYVSILYYSDTRAVNNYFSAGYVDFAPRAAFLGFLRGWSEVPIIGWLFHGNFWVILTLLAMCVELCLKRYRSLLWQLPLLVQMAVMVAAPANNFDRHMIGISAAFAVVAFSLLTTSSSISTSTQTQS